MKKIGLLLLLKLLSANCGNAQVILEKIKDDVAIDQATKDTLPTVPPDSLYYEIIDAFKEENDTIIEHISNVDYRKIVILLPFQFNKNNGYYSSKLDDKSKTATFLYEGMKMALDSLGKIGLYADVYVIDNTDNPQAIDSLMQLPHIRNADLVLGPVYNPSIRIAVGYSVTNTLPFVSLMSPTSNLASYNPYFMQLNPSLDLLQRNLLIACVKKQKNKKIYIVDSMEEEESIRRRKMQVYLDEINKHNESKVQLINITMLEDWAYKFDSTTENVIIINSFKEQFAKEVSDKLKTVSSAVSFSIYGMPAWRDFKGMKELFYGKSVYCLTPYFYDNTAVNYLDICKKFRKTNSLLPNETIIKGFDMMMFFGWQMIRYKTDFWKKSVGVEYDGITSYFKIGENKDPETATFNYYENKHSFTLVFNAYEKRWIRYIE